MRLSSPSRQQVTFSVRFEALSQWLTKQRHYWDIAPFELVHHQTAFANDPLLSFIRGLTHQQVIAYRQSPDDWITAAKTVFPGLADVSELVRLDESAIALANYPKLLQTGMPGRKWQQISAFFSAIEEGEESNEFVDWCAGKGYLSRLLGHTQKPVTALEWNQHLCDAGDNFSTIHHQPVSFECVDVLAAESERYLSEHSHVTGLHACGGLHMRMLEASAQQNVARISLSPCCYHLIKTEHYHAMSAAGKNSELTFNRKQLRVAVQQTVTASQGVRRQRDTEVSFRLGLDALMRKICATSEYTPFPSCQKSLLSTGFEGFCRWACEQKQITLPDNVDYPYWQKLGEGLMQTTEQFELMLDLFRRPIEVWLALDKALYLEENGYDVSLTSFCERQLTPRNIMINSVRRLADNNQ